MATKNITQNGLVNIDNALLRPSIYGLLAVIAGIIGLASSAVTAKFFVLGMERMEADIDARQALIATGILMVITELAAFGMAALLPRQTLRGLRVRLMLCGALLLSFEAVTIYVTQATLAQAGNAVDAASMARIADLHASIDNQRSAAKGLRDGGTLQSASGNAWTRHLGAVALRNALEVEQNLIPLAQEVARVASTVRPTMTDILGPQGMLAYAVARAMLTSMMGLAMFGAAGALLRAARETACGHPTVTTTTVAAVPSVTVTPTACVPSYRQGATAAPKGFSTYLPSLRFVAIPIAALSVSPATLAFSAANIPPVRTVTAPSQSSQEESQAESQYQRVRHGVMAGHIKPSVRGIQSRVGGGTQVVRRYLQQLETEGVIARFGQGWTICTGTSPESRHAALMPSQLDDA